MGALGAVLLVSGLLLCLSIAWAVVGFVMMGVTFVCLLVAEQRITAVLYYRCLRWMDSKSPIITEIIAYLAGAPFTASQIYFLVQLSCR